MCFVRRSTGNLLSGLAIGTTGYQGDFSQFEMLQSLYHSWAREIECASQRKRSKQLWVCCKQLIKWPQEGRSGVLVEVLSSDVGQAVNQQQDRASHRCQTLCPNKQCVFGTLNGENTQTRRCPLEAAVPLTHIPYFYRIWNNFEELPGLMEVTEVKIQKMS